MKVQMMRLKVNVRKKMKIKNYLNNLLKGRRKLMRKYNTDNIFKQQKKWRKLYNKSKKGK